MHVLKTALFGELTIDRDQITSLVRDEVINVANKPIVASAKVDSASMPPTLPAEAPEAVAAMVVEEDVEPSKEILAAEATETAEIVRKVNAEKHARKMGCPVFFHERITPAAVRPHPSRRQCPGLFY